MLIVVEVCGYYDWEPMADGASPSPEEVMALRAKPSLDGKWLKKVVVDMDEGKTTHTQIGLPESEIADCMAHFERIGSPKDRKRVVAWYLEEKTMPHHAHPEHFVNITVHDEPEVEEFLNKYFETDKGAQ